MAGFEWTLRRTRSASYRSQMRPTSDTMDAGLPIPAQISPTPGGKPQGVPNARPGVFGQGQPTGFGALLALLSAANDTTASEPQANPAGLAALPASDAKPANSDGEGLIEAHKPGASPKTAPDDGLGVAAEPIPLDNTQILAAWLTPPPAVPNQPVTAKTSDLAAGGKSAALGGQETLPPEIPQTEGLTLSSKPSLALDPALEPKPVSQPINLAQANGPVPPQKVVPPREPQAPATYSPPIQAQAPVTPQVAPAAIAKVDEAPVPANGVVASRALGSVKTKTSVAGISTAAGPDPIQTGITAKSASAIALASAQTHSDGAGGEPAPEAEAVLADIMPEHERPGGAAQPSFASALHATHNGANQVKTGPETVTNLAAHIIRNLEGKATRFDVELHPADLGRVDVRLEIGARGRLRASMSFENPQAAADLRGRSEELLRALESAGFDLSGGLSFDVAGDRNSNPNQARQDGPNGGGEHRGRAFDAAMALADGASSAALAINTYQSRRAAGLDIRI